jgi:CxxC motif-containing protein (DUF1111 family)
MAIPGRRLALVLLFGSTFLAACRSSGGGDDDDGGGTGTSWVALGGEAGTVYNATSKAYREPLPVLSEAEMAKHVAGDALFESTFVSAPAVVNPGLGPLYNNTACSRCHLNEGRGSPVVGEGPQGSQMLVFVSMPQGSGEPEVPNGPVPVPGVGLQVLDQAIFGHEPNAAVSIAWTEEAGAFADGTPFSLRRPVPTITLADGSKLPEGASVSLRQPLGVYGLGLLEAVSEADVLALVERTDKVPGRVNHVWSRTTHDVRIGRFGRKATKPTIRDQAGQAFAVDMGLTNPLFPPADGAELELTDEALDQVAYYLQSLAVPARRDADDPEVLRGEQLFRDIGCNGCHVEELTTSEHAVIPALAGQTIHPYTDLLLHDMGEGLADGRPEFEATGSEWRTPALWGVGLAQTVHPYATYLHDGRARSLEEAILWHGGQAAGRRESFRSLPKADRDALVRFLRSL